MSEANSTEQERYGRWTVISKVTAKKRHWLCQCDCGKLRLVYGSSLTGHYTRSCGGCVPHYIKHGGCHRSEYEIWSGIKKRCFNKKCKAYKSYGGRGITMCEHWRNSFQAFLDDMGERPSDSHSVDRIDNNGNYEPGNCRWATDREQCNNARRTRLITHNGITLPLSYWADKVGLSYKNLAQRLDKYKWPFERAITEPLIRGRPNRNVSA